MSINIISRALQRQKYSFGVDVLVFCPGLGLLSQLEKISHHEDWTMTHCVNSDFRDLLPMQSAEKNENINTKRVFLSLQCS
jgi:hypothetical protein